MAGNEGVVRALIRLWEPRKASILSKCGKLLAAAGQDLMRVALMPDIKYNAVAAAIIDAMKRHCKLDCSQIGSEMSARLRQRLDKEIPDLAAQGLQFIGIQFFYII